MASMFQRKPSGIYVVQYKNIQGRLITKSTGTKDKKLAQFFKKDLEVQLEKGLLKDKKEINFETYFPQYLKDIESLAKKTKVSYECITRRFVKCARKRTLSSITEHDIIRFLDFYTKNKPKTYNNVLITLSRFFRPAVRWGYVDRNPAQGISQKKLGVPQPKFFTDEEYLRMESVSQNEPVYPMIVTARYTGLRLGELLALEWQDFDWKRRFVRVVNKPYHTIKNYQNRVVPISDELRIKLENYIRSEGVCFPTYCGERQGQRYVEDGPKRQLRRIFEEAEITRDRRFGWHDFRHTFASRLVQEGVSIYKVCKWLGHANVSTTQVYAQFAPSYDEDIENLRLDKPGDFEDKHTKIIEFPRGRAVI